MQNRRNPRRSDRFINQFRLIEYVDNQMAPCAEVSRRSRDSDERKIEDLIQMI